MSRPMGGRSVQLRGAAFESKRSRHFPYMDLFSSGALSVVFIAKALAMLGVPRSLCNLRIQRVRQ